MENAHIVHILSYWFQNGIHHEVSELVLHFPFREHLYQPEDPVSGRVAEKLKNPAFIANSEEYNSAYSQVGELQTLGADWRLFDVK